MLVIQKSNICRLAIRLNIWRTPFQFLARLLVRACFRLTVRHGNNNSRSPVFVWKPEVRRYVNHGSDCFPNLTCSTLFRLYFRRTFASSIWTAFINCTRHYPTRQNYTTTHLSIYVVPLSITDGLFWSACHRICGNERNSQNKTQHDFKDFAQFYL